MSENADAPVAMNDLAERLLEPGGPAEAARHAERLETLREEIRRQMQAGAPPDLYERLQLLARALDQSRAVMLAVTQRQPPDAARAVQLF